MLRRCRKKFVACWMKVFFAILELDVRSGNVEFSYCNGTSQSPDMSRPSIAVVKLP